jgi:hypothetical protein
MDSSERESMEDLPLVSPRYGFELTTEMATALDIALIDFDSWEDEPVEVMELAIREEVGLAHTLNYNIRETSLLPKELTREFSRANKAWVPGFICPDADQYLVCEQEMRRTGNFREDLYTHEAMVDGSLIYEPEEWAVPYILKIWDSKDPFYAFLGWLGTQEPRDKFSVYDPEPHIGNQLAEVIKKLTSVRIRAEEQQDMMVAINLSQGESATAEEILDFFAGYE